MASTSGDQQLASILGEPPRKRRAAALAAQKNWQLFETPDEEVMDDNDIIFISEKETTNRPTNNVSIVSHNFQTTGPLVKRTSNPVLINLLENKNRNKSAANDTDYTPNAEDKRVMARQSLTARKTITLPTRTVLPNRSNTVQNFIQKPIRPKGQEMVSIVYEDSNRVIVRTNQSQYRKPAENKLHPNEPIVLPEVDGEVEEIVGTYEVDNEDNHNTSGRENEELINGLDLELFCGSDEMSDQNKTDDSIEVIDMTEDNDQKINTNNQILLINTNKTTFLRSSVNTPVRRPMAPKPSKTKNTILATLEMDCEECDDEFTDSLTFDCEEDILSVHQWNQMSIEKKEYDKYVNSVKSTKNVKFLPENKVTEALGVVTTTVSETTRVVVKPAPQPKSIPIKYRVRKQGQQISQSIRTPIPAVNQINILRPQRMSAPIRAPNRYPIALQPTSTAGGVPLILTPMAPNIMTTPGFTQGVRLFLPPGSAPGSTPQSTFLMFHQTPAINTIPTTNTYLSSNQTINYPQNFITTNSGQSIRISTPSPPRYRSPNPILTSQLINSTPSIRGTAFRQPVPNTYSNINRINNQNTSVINPNDPNVNSIFNCFSALKSAQNSKKINIRNVLTVKPLPFSWPSNIDDLISSLIKLDNALMKEKFKESPIAWMVSAQLIVPPNCRVCQKGLCNQINKTQNTKNEYWQCNNQRCNTSYLIDRPRVFSDPKFEIPVSKLLFIIYYWSIQVDVEDLIKTGQIEMGTEKIFYIWQQLQKVCSFALKTKDSKLGSAHRDVEIASVEVGRFHVMGAMETVSHRTKICVVPLSNIVGSNGKQSILQPFINWLEKGANIKTCETKFMALRDYGFKVTIITKNEFLSQNKGLSLTTIGGYLIHHLQRFFKDFDLTSLTFDILSNILDELLWRERYGTNPFAAFYNIVKHIAEQCGLRKPELNTNIQIPLPIQIRPNTNLQTYSPAPKRLAPRVPLPPAAQPLDETNSVFVDEYYYSSLKLKTSVEKNKSQEEETPKDQIQCHLCQMFFDNILIVKHMLEHLEKERGGRVRKGDNNENECKHCLRFFNTRALHMHDELANLQLIAFSCRICAVPFFARHLFIQHMKTNHFSGEMPYYCDICLFRSSFQKNLLDHFEEMHSNSSHIMCPFCIRVFELSKFKNLSLFVYKHLSTHYAIASVYECDKCVLTFTTKTDLKDHCFKGHNPINAIDEKFEIIPYVVKEEEKALCSRARETELFTPFLPNFGENAGIGATSETNSDDKPESMEFSCEPDISEFLSIEPECQISLTDAPQTIADFILPVDADYSNDQLKQMLTNSFDVEELEGNETQTDLILSKEQKVICFECKSQIKLDHFISKTICEKCNFTTHCKTASTEHSLTAHSPTAHSPTTPSPAPEPLKQKSVLSSFTELVSFNIVCKDCDFSTQDGNTMALHMIGATHVNILCKPLPELQTITTEITTNIAITTESVTDSGL